jgi:hypothetical protein
VINNTIVRIDLDKLNIISDDRFTQIELNEGYISDAFISPFFNKNNESIILLDSVNLTITFYSITYRTNISSVSLTYLPSLDTGTTNIDMLVGGKELILFNTSPKQSYSNYLLTLPEDEILTTNTLTNDIVTNFIALSDMTNFIKVTCSYFKKISCLVYARAKELKVIIYKSKPKTKTQGTLSISLKYIQGGISIYYVNMT